MSDTKTLISQKQQIDSDLAAKGHLGAVMYTLIWLLVMMVSPLTEEWPKVTYTVLFFLALTGAVRGYYGINFEKLYAKNPKRWLFIYASMVQGTAITIGLASGFTLWFYTLEMTGYLVTFALGGLVAGGTVSLSTHLSIQRVFIFVMLLPVIIASIFLDDVAAYTLAGIFVFDIIYLAIVGKRSNAEYMSAITANRLLSERADELEQARIKAESLDRAKSHFLSQINHELRTPLSSIIGFARLLERSKFLSNQDREQVSIINRSGAYLLKLINDVLDLSKIEAGKTVAFTTVFDLKTMLDEVMEMVSVAAEKKHLDLQFEMSASVPRHIKSDELKLRQIVINLLNNAIKSTQHGSVTLIVDTEVSKVLSELEQKIVFTVRDTGIGISDEDKTEIFKLFTQSTSVGFQEGTGLGLAISSELVDLLGGKINVESTLNKGSTFTFFIIADVVAAQEGGMVPVQTSVIGMESQQDINILIAEDNEDIRQLLVSILDPVGFHLTIAHNGQEAVDFVKENTPDIVLMDLMMPIMDGYTAVKVMRDLSAGERTPVVACTADSFEGAKTKALEAGFNDVLRKPFVESDVFAMIKKHVPVKYTYAAAEKSAQSNSVESDDIEVLTPVSIHDISAEIKYDSLREGIELGDIEIIKTQIEQWKSIEPPLFARLSLLLNNFLFDDMENLLDNIESYQVNQ